MTARHSGASRRALASGWARAVSTTAYLPMSTDQIEHRLGELVDRIVDQLVDGGSATPAAAEAGVALVGLHCTGQRSLFCSVEALGNGLPALPELAGVDRLQAKVIAVLGALSAGYADALRRLTLEQQEAIKKALEQVLRLSEARFREVFTSSAIGIAISDLDGMLVQTNRAFAEILGYDDGELAARNLYELMGQSSGLRSAYLELVNGRHDRFRTQQPLVRKEGDESWVHLAVSALRDERGVVTRHVTMVEDITDQHLLQVQLNNQALRDMLTGLPNRQAFGLKLEKTLGQLEPNATVTLFHLDIDGFAVLNTGLGHEAGDQVLRLVAQRLEAVFADERAMVGRIAADEFAVLVENSPTTPDVDTFAARINESLAEPAYLDTTGLAATVSIGVVQRPAGGIHPAELLRQSDATLRRAKSHGRRQWAIFNPQQDTAERQRFVMAAGLPGALETGQLKLTYRPLVSLADRRIVAVEALVGWDHPERGPIGHDEVIELAAHTGMVLLIGEWLLDTAGAQTVAWQETFGDLAPPLAVNLSVAQANDPDLVKVVNGMSARTGLAAGRLQLGFPVGALQCEDGDADDNLRVLAEIGVQTAVHGFGGGHGGLVFLEDLPIRSAWIAGWLVRRLANRPGSVTGRALADLISLVHTFRSTVVVAGVQSAEQAAWWRTIGGDIASGGWYADAGPPELISNRLAAVGHHHPAT